MMSAEATNEGGNYGPNSWTYWQKQRQLLAAQAANEGGNYGECLSMAIVVLVRMLTLPCSLLLMVVQLQAA
jgi:hypothetical protein